MIISQLTCCNTMFNNWYRSLIDMTRSRKKTTARCDYTSLFWCYSWGIWCFLSRYRLLWCTCMLRVPNSLQLGNIWSYNLTAAEKTARSRLLKSWYLHGMSYCTKIIVIRSDRRNIIPINFLIPTKNWKKKIWRIRHSTDKIRKVDPHLIIIQRNPQFNFWPLSRTRTNLVNLVSLTYCAALEFRRNTHKSIHQH